jgi:hypothetical protein
MDHYSSPSTAAVGCVLSGGSATYSVQHTYDDVFSPSFNPATATWINHPVLNAQTATADSNYAYPPRGVRLNVTAGTGTVTMTVNQAGII